MHTVFHVSTVIGLLTGTLLASTTEVSVDPGLNPASALRQPDAVLVTGHEHDGDDIVVTSSWATTPKTRPPMFHPGTRRGIGPCGDWSALFHEVGSPPEGDTPSCAAFTLDGSEFIIGHRDSQNLIIYDASTRAFLREIPLSGSPQDIALLPDGVHAVVGNIAEDTISIVDLIAASELDVIPVGTMPGVVDVTADGSKVIVGNTGDSEISIIDLATGQELHAIGDAPFTMTFTVASESGAVAVDFNRFAVVGSETIVHPASGDDAVLFIDIDSGSVTSEPCTNWPRGIAISSDGSSAVVTHYTEPIISLIDIPNSTVRSTIDIGSDCSGPVAIDPDGDKAAVAVLNNCRVVDLNAGTVSGDLSTATVYSMHATSDGQYAVCSGYRGSIIDFDSETIVANVNNTVSAPVAAVSPVEPLAVMAANTFGEDMVVANVDGAAGQLIEVLPTGPEIEGDKCRSVAAHEATDTVVAVNLFSRNAEIIEASTGTVQAVVPTGIRPSKVAITPAGDKAVIANLDSTFASVIDLTSFSVTEVPISRRASRVCISPDGSYAYVAVVADGDGIWKIDLNTMTTIGGKLLTGNMGSVGYAYSQPSGLVLSHDGSRLVTCDSFDDTITIVDTATWSVEATLFVGSFPTMATFSEDDSTIYVSVRDMDSVAIIDVSGTPALATYILVGDFPGETAVSADGTTLFVLNTNEDELGIVDLGSGIMTTRTPLPYNPVGLSVNGDCVLVGTGTSSTSAGGSGFISTQDGALVFVDAMSHAIIDEVATGVSAAELAVDGNLAAIAAPPGDGVAILGITIDCPGDIDGDGDVGVEDLLAVIAGWGTPYNVNDLLLVIGNWNSCP